MNKTLDFPWRKTYESYAAVAWSAGALSSAYLAATSGPLSSYGHYVGATAMLFATTRWFQSFKLWERKSKLSEYELEFIDQNKLAKMINKHPDKMWLGHGFEWKNEHAQRVFDLKKVDLSEIEPPAWYRAISGKKRVDDKTRGAAWIHGLETKEIQLYVDNSHLKGHTICLGTTGSGKTRLADLMTTSAILKGANGSGKRNTVIVLDPKGDQDLLECMMRASKLAGREEDFVYFHPAHPEHSFRIDPMANWNRPTELASRIAALMPSEGGNDAFVAFSWRAIQIVVQGLIFTDVRPNLRNIRRFIEGGPEGLIIQVLEKHFANTKEDWIQEVRSYLGKKQDTEAIARGYIEYYRKIISKIATNETVDGLVSMFEHSRDHQVKMIASLLPVLTMLTSGDIGDLLSPNLHDLDDPRPITDTRKIIDGNKILYLATDSLSDRTVGAALGSIFLADLTAVCGDRYNYGSDPEDVALFIDEANEIVNDPFISILNKGRGAGFIATVYSQTFSDFVARTGSEDKARQVLGNVNNLIALRSKDRITQDYITETFGSATVFFNQLQSSTSAMGNDKDPTNFTTNYGERLTEDSKAQMFPPELLGQLPDLHYVAQVSGGRLIKGKLPIITSDDHPTLDDMPWFRNRQI